MAKKSVFKYGLYSFIFVAIVLCLTYCNSILYGINQGKGQLKILVQTQDFTQILSNPSTPDSTKNKIRLVQEIKQFCMDSLHLESGNNYTGLFDQKGQPGMYVLTASKPYSLENYEWKFPFLGKFTYKGFFEKDKGLKEQKALADKGLDTDLDEVNAWSTLGWFNDPVMSSMLDLNEYKLARVLIHEITHYNVFVKDDIEYNENLASFIGDRGTEKYLSSKYGSDSKELNEFSNYLNALDLFTSYIVHAAANLQLFYETNAQKPQIEQLKKEKIKSIIQGLDTLPIKTYIGTDVLIAQADEINNTFFTDFLTYKKNNADMMNTLVNEFEGDIVQYIEAQKNKYGN